MKRTAPGLVVIVFAAATVLAQGTPPAKTSGDPTVDQILEKYVAALGGKAAIQKLNSRVGKGTFEAPDQNASGTFETYAKAPNKTASVVDVPGFGQFLQGFDGSTGWAVAPGAGARTMEGQELSSASRSAEFYQAIKLRELYPKLTLKGKEKVGSHETYVVEGEPGDGTLRRIYFDTSTWLIVRSDIERDTPQGRATFESDLDDYRAVDDVKVPFSIRQVTPQLTLFLKFEEIHHNVPIEDSKFAPPAAH